MLDRPAPLLLLAAALLAGLPGALAQTAGESGESPVLVELLGEPGASTRVGGTAVYSFTLFNLHSSSAFFVTATADGLEPWTLDAQPNKFFLAPRITTTVNVTLSADERPPERTSGRIVFHLVNSDTGVVHRVAQEATVTVADAALVVGLFENPLPPPLDGGYGVFLLNLAFWAAFGVASFLAGDSIVRYATRRSKVETTRTIIAKLRWPVFTFVLLLGVKQSVDVLPDNAVALFLARFVAVVAYGAGGAYVAFRLIDAALYYYRAEVAPRTTTRVDDVLVPFLRKLSMLVIVAVAIGYTLSVFGINPGVIFAGAGLAGLVIAFAAQDTLSNFFSGIFLILDRPFLEGDIIQLESGETVRVETIGLRSTSLYHMRHHQVIVLPNNQLASRRIINLSFPDPSYRIAVEFTVPYRSDTDLVQAIVQRACLETEGVVKDKVPQILFWDFADSGIRFQARIFIVDVAERRRIASEIRESIHRAFVKEGLELALPQRIVTVREPSAPAPREK